MAKAKTDAERAKQYILRMMNVGDCRKISDGAVDNVLTKFGNYI